MQKSESTSNMLNIIIKADCVNPRDKWVDLDHVWQDPENLDHFADSFIEYLSQYKERISFNKIVVAVKVYGPFGVLPIVAVCSAKANIPFVIWKEWARPATGGSILYGSIDDGDELLIVHDVINYGGTIVKEKEELETFAQGKKYKIVGVLSIIMREQKGFDFAKERLKIPVEAIISWQELAQRFAS